MANAGTRTVTMRGNPKTLSGSEVRAGDRAPEARVVDPGLNNVTIGGAAGQVQILLSVPSLDTPVCALETKRFNEEAAALPDVAVRVVSMDLPFAMKRWCGAEGVERVQTFSDHRHGEFGERYGVMMDELRIHARAAFVVDKEGKVVHAQYVPEVAEHPDYDAILNAAREAAAR